MDIQKRIDFRNRTEKDCIQEWDGEGLYTRIGWRRIANKNRTEKGYLQ